MSRPEGSAEELEQRRRRAVAMVQRGATQRDAALRYGVTQSAVSRWVSQLRDKGEAGLAARPTPGRPAALSDRQKRQLIRLLRKRPADLGFAGDRWTASSIRQLIGDRFGVWYHRDHMSRVVRDLADY